MNQALAFLLSSAYDGALAPEHWEDLQKSGLTEAVVRMHKIRSVPPGMINALAGFNVEAVRSACLFPFPDPAGGWLDYVKMKVFGNDTAPRELRGDNVEDSRARWRYNGGLRKYIVRRKAHPHLYIPIPTMAQALEGTAPLWLCEGMKKALAVAQLGQPVVGIESAWTWHTKGSRALLPDFGAVRLRGRVVEVLPDSDVDTKPLIHSSMRQLADALRAVGARPRLVRLPGRPRQGRAVTPRDLESVA